MRLVQRVCLGFYATQATALAAAKCVGIAVATLATVECVCTIVGTIECVSASALHAHALHAHFAEALKGIISVIRILVVAHVDGCSTLCATQPAHAIHAVRWGIHEKRNGCAE